MIKINNLKKNYGEQIVFDDLNLEVGREIVGLIGANGTGKTTLFKCLLGLIDFEGDIFINGMSVKKSSAKDAKEIRHLIGYVPQYLPIWGDIKMQEAMNFFCKLRGVSIEKGKQLLSDFGLLSRQNQDKKISMLSGGMRQKLSLAIALISDPQLILLDEPTANLDAWATKEILSIMASWKGQKSVLLSSHRLEEIHLISDRIVQIHQGKIFLPQSENIALTTIITQNINVVKL